DGDACRDGDLATGRDQGRHAALVVADGILADLQDAGSPGVLEAGDDALGVLERDDVEREHGAAVARRRSDEVPRRGQGHRAPAGTRARSGSGSRSPCAVTSSSHRAQICSGVRVEDAFGSMSTAWRTSRGSPVRAASTVSAPTETYGWLSAAHWAGSEPIGTGRRPSPSTAAGTSTTAPWGRLSISPWLGTLTCTSRGVPVTSEWMIWG